MTETSRPDNPIPRGCLPEGLDWVAYETIWRHIQTDVPPQWDERWRELACGSLHELVLKQMKDAVRKATVEAWENYWREVQTIERAKNANASPPTS